MNKKIWLSPPHLTGEEQKYVKEAFDTNWVAPLGPNVDGFEQDICKYTGVKACSVLSSGTAALHLALIILGVQENDEVLCSTFTFSATVNPIRYLKAIPIFIDSEKETWNMSPELLEESILDRINKGKKPKAIILVHLYGMPSKMDEILAISKKYNIPVIEDAAEAIGATYKNKAMGTFGEIGIFSFNGNKIITTGAGGAILSEDKKLIDKANFLASQAKESELFYQHKEVGYNYQMTTLQAAMGLAQIEKLNNYINLRRRNFKFYKQNLSPLGFEFLDEPNADYFSNRWLSTCLLPNKLNPIQVIKALKADKIEARYLWKPMHLQPLFKNIPYFGDNLSSKLFNQGVCLPSGSSLSINDLNRIINIIKKLIET